MKILYYGTLGEIGTKLCNYLSRENSVTAYTDNIGQYELDCKVQSENEMAIEQIIEQIGPDIMVCYGIWIQTGEAFYNTIKCARASGVNHFVILQEAGFFRKAKKQSDLLNIICRNSETDSFKTHIISCSVLYGNVTAPAYLHDSYIAMQRHNEISFPEMDSVYCDCLHIDDFCKLLGVLLKENIQDLPPEMNLQSSYPFKIDRFVEIFSSNYPQATCSRNEIVEEELNMTFDSVPGWMPEHNFIQETADVFEIVELSARSHFKSHQAIMASKAAKMVDFIVVFGAIEIYLNFVPVASELQFVDFRLLLIICTGLFAGEKNSIFAALLCSISSVLHCLLSGTKWYIIFYHIDNWIPIAVYFIAATLVGIFYEKYCEAGKSDEGYTC